MSRERKRTFDESKELNVKEIEREWTTASLDFHQMAVHKRTTMLAHCNLKQNMWLCSKQSSFFPLLHCPLVANRKTRWSIDWIEISVTSKKSPNAY